MPRFGYQWVVLARADADGDADRWIAVLTDWSAALLQAAESRLRALAGEREAHLP